MYERNKYRKMLLLWAEVLLLLAPSSITYVHVKARGYIQEFPMAACHR